MMPSAKSIFIILVFLTLPLSTHVQGGHSLQGKVIAPNGTQPNGPVKITLTYNGRRMYEAFSDLSGRFSFTGLAPGTYQLTAEGDGQSFETTSIYTEVSAFGSAPLLFSQDIQLRPLVGKPLGQTAVVNAFVQDVPKPARQALDRAMKLSVDNKPDAAIEKMQEAIKLFPQYFEARLQLGNQFMKLGRLAEAIAELDRAREVNANDECLYQSFGLVLMRQRNYAVAVAVFSEASRLNPTNPMNALMKATALIHQAYSMNSGTGTGDREHILNRAEVALTDAASLSDKRLKPDHLTLAMLYEMKEDRARAAAELESYLIENPNVRNAEDLRQSIQKLRSQKSVP
ncbi:MAG: tetratricopeptide repeat protein [Acidobacteriota bacterium]|nr:tetratricopeptide repeat protein [Acidobacteriota bacterium]